MVNRLGGKLRQGLRQITEKIVNVFKPNRQTQEPFWRSGWLGLDGRAVLDQALGASKRGGSAKYVEPSRQCHRCRPATIDFEGQHPTKEAHLLSRHGVARMTRESRVVYYADSRMQIKELGYLLRAFALSGESCTQ